MQTQSWIEVKDEWGIVAARQEGRAISRKIGFGAVDQARITTAISELARNIYLYAQIGKISFDLVEKSTVVGIKKGIKITAKDEGPGIESIQEVMMDGYTTSGGMGAGLPGVKRLMDEFTIHSTKETGTCVVIIKWLR